MLTMTKTDLLTYNAFGIISINPKRITASVTAVAGTKSITRSVVRDLTDNLAAIEDGESTAVVFGAWLQPGKKARITIHEIGKLASGLPVSEIPEVGKVLAEALELVKAAAGLN
jgi:hypothetical protein